MNQSLTSRQQRPCQFM